MNVIQRLQRAFAALPLRTKLILGNIVVATIVILAIGLVAVNRTADTANNLTSQLVESERQREENKLTDSAERYARDLSEFFVAIQSSIEILGQNAQVLLTQEDTLGEGLNWDARQQLFQLETGSWDNTNNEAGSIFIPVNGSPATTYSEINTLKQLDYLAPGLLQKNPDLVAVYFGSAKGMTMYYPNVDLASLLPPDFDITQRPWYLAAAPEANANGKVVWSKPYVDAALNGLVVTCSSPVLDDRGRFRGVAAMDLQLTKITDIIESIRVGNTGYAFLIDGEGHLIAISEVGYKDFGITGEDLASGAYLEKSLLTESPIGVFAILVKMTSSQTGIEIATLSGIEKYIAYYPIKSVGYSLGIVVDVSETQGNVIRANQQLELDTQRTVLNLAGIMVAVWAIFLLASRWMGNALTVPLVKLTAAARLIARGDLSAELKSDSTDEVGLLANTLATMTKNLRGTIDATEQRVIERTAELRQAVNESEKRAQELKTISEVSRAISTEIELENLLNAITYLVSERFGYYHVGVFLIDAATKYAILRAANSPGGKRMLERGHQLQVGQEGIVGYVTGTGEARIALDVGEDAVYFNNPDMPNTRSEMALPLKLRGRIIGALDVQSVEPNAFKTDDVETLGVLADQIAIAIDNARLLAESQQALAEVQTLYGEYVGRTWDRKTAKTPIGYHYAQGGGRSLIEPVVWEEGRDAIATGRTLVTATEGDGNIPVSGVAVPIRLYNQTIGVINLRSADPRRRWKEDEIAVIESVAERLGLALENARLFEETSARASREHTVAEITSKIRSTNDPQAMIRIAIEELQQILGVTRVEIIPQVVKNPPAGTG